MGDRVSTEEVPKIPEELRKEAVDALAQLPDADRRETFDYFKTLVEFQKHASNKRRL